MKRLSLSVCGGVVVCECAFNSSYLQRVKTWLEHKYGKQSPQIITLQQGMDFLLLLVPACMWVFLHTCVCVSSALASPSVCSI